MNAAELVAAARALLVEATPATRGLWSRLATHLARQALEAAVAEHWDRTSRGLSSANMRTQLICLRAYRDDTDVCRQLAWAWSELSDAAHARGGPPTRADLDTWLGTIERSLRRAARGAPREVSAPVDPPART